MEEIIDLCSVKSNRSTDSCAAILVDDTQQDADASPTGISNRITLQELAMQRTLVSQAIPSGNINGTLYESACTNGDGACGLQALFGVSVHGELFAADIRTRRQ